MGDTSFHGIIIFVFTTVCYTENYAFRRDEMDIHTLFFILAVAGLVGIWSVMEKRWNWTVAALIVGFFGVAILAAQVFGVR